LGIQLFSHGVRLSPDLGTPGYGIGLTDAWYRQTISHNTVLLDGRSQPPGSAHIAQFQIDDNAVFVQARVSWDEGIYAGVQMNRMILWREKYFVDVFWVDCRESHQIDWVYHNAGELFEPLARSTITRDSKSQLGYAQIANASQIYRAENVRLSWRTNGARLALLFVPCPGEEIFTGHAPGNPASQSLSVVVRRQTGSSASFLSVFCLSSANEEPVVRRVSWTHADHSSQEIVVETTNGSDKWTVPLVILPKV
jgi:hypothetical protein